jgi:glycerol-3-phosphate dehydrogenase (NAD+)
MPILKGLIEITHYVEHFYPGSDLAIFFESCGVADLVTTCYGGIHLEIMNFL